MINNAFGLLQTQYQRLIFSHASGACSAQCSGTRTHRYKGRRFLFETHYLPLIVRISSVCFTLFTAILLRSLISCIIEQPVYKSQAGCDGCVRVVGWTSFQLADVMAFWNQRSGTLCEAEITSSFFVMEDTRKMIRQQDCHCGCVKVPNARLRSYF